MDQDRISKGISIPRLVLQLPVTFFVVFGVLGWGSYIVPGIENKLKLEKIGISVLCLYPSAVFSISK